MTDWKLNRSATQDGGTSEQQEKGLRQAGVDVQVLFVDRYHNGWTQYFMLASKTRDTVRHSDPDIVHTMYGGVMADCAKSRGGPTDCGAVSWLRSSWRELFRT